MPAKKLDKIEEKSDSDSFHSYTSDSDSDSYSNSEHEIQTKKKPIKTKTNTNIKTNKHRRHNSYSSSASSDSYDSEPSISNTNTSSRKVSRDPHRSSSKQGSSHHHSSSSRSSTRPEFGRSATDLSDRVIQDRSERENTTERHHHSHRSTQKDSSRTRKSSRSASHSHSHSNSNPNSKSSKPHSHRHRSSKNKKKGTPLDTIDKLDVTGFFGGGAFHHDGPFDACTPHRNKVSQKAPVNAFPADGPNNALGALPASESKNQAINNIMGRNDADDDNAIETSASLINNGHTGLTRKVDPYAQSIIAFDTRQNAEPVHGDPSLGLGSTTFLEGSVAPRSAILEEAALSRSKTTSEGGLGRSKSLARVLRKGSTRRRLEKERSENLPPRPDRETSNALHLTQSIDSNDSFETGGEDSLSTSAPHAPTLATGGYYYENDKKQSVNTIVKPVEQSSKQRNNMNGGSSFIRRVKSLKVGGKRA